MTDLRTEADTAHRGLAPRGPAWLRVLVLPIFWIIPTIVVMIVFSLLTPTVEAGGTTLEYVAAGVIHGFILVSAIGTAWLFMRFVQREPLRTAGLVWTGRSIGYLLLGVTISVVIMIAEVWPADAAGLLRPTGPSPITAAEFVLFLTAAFAMQAIPEELFFRGIMLRVLRTRPYLAVWVSALLFGLAHFVSSGGQENLVERMLYVGQATGFGLLAAALVLYTRSLWSAVGIHGGLHTGIHLNAWTGHGDGPVAWGIGTALFTAAALVVLGLAKRRGREQIVIDR